MMKKNYLPLLICALLGMITLTGCDSKEVVTLAVETEALFKTNPGTIGGYIINDAVYDRKANVVSLKIVSEPLYTEEIGQKALNPKYARQGMDLLMRTSQFAKLLVALVNAEATLNIEVSYPKSQVVNLTYTPEQLKSFYDEPQLTASEFAAQSLAVNINALNEACPLPFMPDAPVPFTNNKITLEKATLTDSVVTFDIKTVSGEHNPTLASYEPSCRAALLEYITKAYNGPNNGWQTLIKEMWELDYTLRIVVADSTTSQVCTCDFPARTSLYWIMNPK